MNALVPLCVTLTRTLQEVVLPGTDKAVAGAVEDHVLEAGHDGRVGAKERVVLPGTDEDIGGEHVDAVVGRRR